MCINHNGNGADKNLPKSTVSIPEMVRGVFADIVGQGKYGKSFLKLKWVQWSEYQTRNQEVAGSTQTRSTANNLEQVANLLCAQANSASYPQRDGK